MGECDNGVINVMYKYSEGDVERLDGREGRGWAEGLMDGWRVVGWLDGWMDGGWVDRWVDGWMDGREDRGWVDESGG